MLKTELAYPEDSIALFNKVSSRPWAVFLDSGSATNRCGRFDIISFDPVTTLITRGERTSVLSSDVAYTSLENPFHLVQEHLLTDQAEKESDLPFSGGAIGYFSYDLGRRLETLPENTSDDEYLPQMAIGIYDWAVVIDHELQQCWMIGQGKHPSTWENWKLWQSLLDNEEPDQASSFTVTGEISSDTDFVEYSQAFEKVKQYIIDGDCYQINLAQRFQADCQGSPIAAYKKLRQINSAPYGAYMNLPFTQILSSSPELFIHCENNIVTTKPIKGTRAKGVSTEENNKLVEELKNSKKDQSENVMIVDLLRNDFSKNCKINSVKVPELFAIESFATVHHLVSTVTGELEEGRTCLDLIQGCFPGGSITGAPKVRAMEIIEELESHRRGVYCGSIGYIGYDGSMQTNISIRTLTCNNGKIIFWAGGGIVADSTLQGEYQESLDKAKAMFSLLRSL